MTILHSEPSSGMSTRILCLTSYNKSLTPTTTLTAATLTAATFTAATTMQTLQPSTPNSTQNFNTNLNQHQNQNHGAVTPQDSEQQLEELDIEAELRADGDQPFPIDRRAIKDVVQEKLGVRVERVAFLSAGTFHKAFLLHLDRQHLAGSVPPTVVFRIARRTMHMPKLKTESEVATLAYLRTCTSVPVPTVYWYDANPFNILGGEWIVMSKAKGLPLSRFYHTLPQDTLRALLANLASLLIPLFEHRFPSIGSLYFSDPPSSTTAPPPGTAPLITVPSSHHISPPHISPAHIEPAQGIATLSSHTQITPGPIISYPFFGSSRGLLSHLSSPPEIERGPWSSFAAYLASCVEREIDGVVREGLGQQVSRRPRVAPMSEEGSDNSAGEGGSDGGEEEGDGWGVNWNATTSGKRRIAPAAARSQRVGGSRFGPSDFGFGDSESESDTDTASGSSLGDDDRNDTHSYYRDYRATQRSTFLVAHTARREASVREEMGVFMEVMEALREEAEGGLGLGEEGERGKGKQRRRQRIDGGEEEEEDESGEGEFTLDCHDLSLENVFVDEDDHTKITCIIDWESTCIRPLFQAAHLPTFLQPHHGHGHYHGHHYSHYNHHGHHGHHTHHRSHGHTPHRPYMSRTHSSTHTHAHAHSHSIHLPHLPRYLSSRTPAAQTFRAEVARLGTRTATRWLHLEATGAKRRWAHRVVEWDGWEEGLAGEILGELEYGWEMEVEMGVVGGSGSGGGVDVIGAVLGDVSGAEGVIDGLGAGAEGRRVRLGLGQGQGQGQGQEQGQRQGQGQGSYGRHGEHKLDRDISTDGGRELGRRLEQWVREGANVGSYHHDGEVEDEEVVEGGC